MAGPASFNPEAFLDAQQSEVNVKRPPLPTANPTRPDGFYVAVLGSPKADAGVVDKPGSDRHGKSWLSMIVPVQVEVPQEVQALLGLKLEKGTITLTDRVMIDLTDQNTIDNSVGRNRRQRQYRDALDMNKPGDVFSWRKVEGQVLLVKIDHEIYNNEIQERVGVVAKRS